MKHLQRILLLLTALIAAVAARAVTVADIPNVHVADARQYVSDPSGILSDETVSRLNVYLARIEKETSAEVVVVMLDNVGDNTTVRDLAYQIQKQWGVGKKDVNNGMVVLVSKDDHRVEIVTGRGLEGIVPDVIAGRVARSVMAPRFKDGDYDGGVIAGVNALGRIIADPENREEVLSKVTVGSGDEDSAEEFWNAYLGIVAVVLAGMVVWVIAAFRSTRRLPLVVRYPRIMQINLGLLILSCISLGPGFIIYGIYRLMLRRLRRRKHLCSNCNHRMKLIDEEHDNDYLTPSQDLEEQLQSVDYDVWECPECRQVDVIPFVNHSSSYQECPRCHARAMVMTADHIVRRPTTRQEGVGERVYVCRNCGHDDHRHYRLPKEADPMSAAAAGAVIGTMLGGRGGGGFSGGGFSGGSFGGGSSAGGGAGASW